MRPGLEARVSRGWASLKRVGVAAGVGGGGRKGGDGRGGRRHWDAISSAYRSGRAIRTRSSASNQHVLVPCKLPYDSGSPIVCFEAPWYS